MLDVSRSIRLRAVRRSLLVPLALVFALALSTAACDSGNNEPDTPPPVPTAVQATAEDGSISVTWTAPAGEVAAAGYNVYRSPEGSDEQVTLNADAPLTETAYTDASAEVGTAYAYRVSAVASSGAESALSASVTARLFPSPPDRP